MSSVVEPTRPSVARAAPQAAERPEIPPHVRQYLGNSYPHNHDYRVVDGQLAPKCKLWVRLRKLMPLYPRPLVSLLDVSCCKGYFVNAAAQEPTCQRALGIDIHQPDLDACEAVKAHLGTSRARFERLRLHDAAARIDQFGGPFQTVLLVNTYQYLFFGSPRSADCYLNHDDIFAQLRRVCAGRVIFNNRTEFDRVQGYCRRVGQERGLEREYCTERILQTASKHFRVTQHGRVGRYPLWALDLR